jgi:hypothetical protein
VQGAQGAGAPKSLVPTVLEGAQVYSFPYTQQTIQDSLRQNNDIARPTLNTPANDQEKRDVLDILERIKLSHLLGVRVLEDC